MSNHAVFVVAPYVAASLFVLVCTLHGMRWWRRPDRGATQSAHGRGPGLVITATRWAFAVIALQHLVAVAAPGAVLLWNRQLPRLLFVETVGLVAGGLALAGLLTTQMRQLRASDGSTTRPPADVVAGTLGLMVTASGVALAWMYRWASSWSEVTVFPYVRSLLALRPATELVAHLPFLVKLHIFASFALLAAAPWSPIVRFVAMAAADRLEWTFALASSLVRRPCRAIAGWSTPHVQAACASLWRSDHEEN